LSSETALSHAIQFTLRGMGAVVERIQTVHGASNGTPDLLVAYRGRVLMLEVKDSAPVSDEQRLWHIAAAAQGLPVEVVRTVPEAVKAVRGDA
jgi:hypothetical protein